MTSTDDRYKYKIAVNPASGLATLEVLEGAAVIHRSVAAVTVAAEAAISLNLKDADLRDVLATFSALTGRKIVAGPGVGGMVSIDAVNIPWDVALSESIAPLGLVAEMRGNEIHIVPAKAPRLDLNTMTPPKVLSRVNPVYPPEAKEAKLQGIVIVEALVDETGRVQETRILKGLPMGLSEAAENAVRQWTFEPARKDGKPTAVMFNITINFKTD